jgi:hypothetical protein
MRRREFIAAIGGAAMGPSMMRRALITLIGGSRLRLRAGR